MPIKSIIFMLFDFDRWRLAGAIALAEVQHLFV